MGVLNVLRTFLKDIDVSPGLLRNKKNTCK